MRLLYTDKSLQFFRKSLKRVEELTGRDITFYEGDVMDAETY